jgi:hypothetical protein
MYLGIVYSSCLDNPFLIVFEKAPDKISLLLGLLEGQ